MKYKIYFLNNDSVIIGEETLNALVSSQTPGPLRVVKAGGNETIGINLDNVTHIFPVIPTESAVINPPTPQSLKEKEQAAKADSVSSVEKIIEKNTTTNEQTS